MRRNDAHRIQAITKSYYATTEDFGKLFTADMNSLYLLSLLLTASHERAEECLVAGLDECVDGNFVSREWAHSWARRMLITQCNSDRGAACQPHQTGARYLSLGRRGQSSGNSIA
jgi:hypothetical protein